MAVLELLYPAAGNLYGEMGNGMYLTARLPGWEIKRDEMGEEPFFVQHDPSLILLGSMTENHQEQSIRLLLPYRDRLFALIEAGTVVLATGNAWEIFTQGITFKNEGRRVEGLGLLPLETETDYFARNHGKVLGTTVGGEQTMKVIGYHARFSQVKGEEVQLTPWLLSEKGEGMNRESKVDGVRYRNFFGTHLLGPLLPTNPDFAEFLLTLTGEALPETEETARLLAVAREAHRRRLSEFEKPGMKY